MGSQNILLGKGIFSIGEIPIGATRGGGQFIVEREVRPIEADGDKGYVKDRIVIDKSMPKLIMNSLEVINENIPKMYAAVKSTQDVQNSKTTITGTGQITSSDYQDFVKWTGLTKGGKQVVIKLFNAINLENIDWSLVDKDEVVSALTYTGCYLEDSEAIYEPWEIEYAN